MAGYRRDRMLPAAQWFKNLGVRATATFTGAIKRWSTWGATATTQWIERDLDVTGTSPEDLATVLLPANSKIRCVTYRVVTAIAGGSSVNIGDSSSGTRFFSAITQTIGATGVKVLQGSDSAQASAGTFRISWTGTNTAGKVRISVLVETYAAPTKTITD